MIVLYKYQPPIPQTHSQPTSIPLDRRGRHQMDAIAKPAKHRQWAKFILVSVMLLPTNIAFATPIDLGRKASFVSDSLRLAETANIILAQESTQVPMRIAYGGTEARDNFILMQLTVPNRDTSQPAYGGKLRFYDVHLAKMFETSYFLCQQVTGFSGYEWNYSAGNGSILMGNFRISCRLAREIASGYGLGKAETTSIAKDTEGGPPESDVYAIPILDITGSKVERWMNFVQSFKPTNR